MGARRRTVRLLPRKSKQVFIIGARILSTVNIDPLVNNLFREVVSVAT